MATTRRQFVSACLTATAAGLAGCSDGGGGGGTTDGGGGDGGDDGGENGGPSPDVEAYRTQLTEELDIEITRLERRDGRVVLAYESTYPTETAEWGYEVGFVSARFGRLVADGWDAGQLSATVTGAEGRTLSWEVDAETARAFVNDEITVDEFVDRVFDSMREQ